MSETPKEEYTEEDLINWIKKDLLWMQGFAEALESSNAHRLLRRLESVQKVLNQLKEKVSCGS